MAEGEKFNWRLTAVWWIVLFVGAMCLMMITAANKTIVIADSASGEQASGAEGIVVTQEISLEETESEAGVFLIPLESDTKAGNVVVENSYLDRELRVFIGGADAQFYTSHSVQGDVSPIVKAVSKAQKSGVLLCLQVDSVYEFQTSMDGDVLKIKANKPKDLYSMVVVVDPEECVIPVAAPEGEMQEELTLAVCRLLAEQWNQENVKLYFTRKAERAATDAERVDLVEDTEADIYIGLAVAEDEDASKYGIRGRYNQEYFIPEFGNVELADILTRNVTIAVDNRAIGLWGTEEDSVLNGLQIPAACVELGYTSNAQESELLAQEGYRQKLAAGVAEAVREVYTSYYEQSIQ